VLVERFDADRSGLLDAPDELASVSCEVVISGYLIDD
jgi:hypothetical protein